MFIVYAHFSKRVYYRFKLFIDLIIDLDQSRHLGDDPLPYTITFTNSLTSSFCVSKISSCRKNLVNRKLYPNDYCSKLSWFLDSDVCTVI